MKMITKQEWNRDRSGVRVRRVVSKTGLRLGRVEDLFKARKSRGRNRGRNRGSSSHNDRVTRG